jgi:YegS/Rv2252/BmrU family lipid kinase
MTTPSAAEDRRLTSPQAFKRATLICNPAAGRGARRRHAIGKIAETLARYGLEVHISVTEAPNQAGTLVSQALSTGSDVIVSCGGDGTLNEIIQGLAHSEVALATWPGGTANVAAKELQVPATPEAFGRMVAAGSVLRIALGRASTAEWSRYFLLFAGIGLDASICRGVNSRLKRIAGEAAFWVSGLRHLLTWRDRPFRIAVDGSEYEGVFALVGNGYRYGGNLCITPDARLAQPWFQVFVLPQRRHRLGYLRDLTNCLLRPRAADASTLICGSHVVVDGVYDTWVEMDGEVVGRLPMRFDVVPAGLTVVVP